MGADSLAENTPKFICPSQKVRDFNEKKKLHRASVVRAQSDPKSMSERINSDLDKSIPFLGEPFSSSDEDSILFLAVTFVFLIGESKEASLSS